ncbi:MAG: hypothetical protein ACOCQQ_01215 [Candidatus Nanoarchaeia archaeon]
MKLNHILYMTIALVLSIFTLSAVSALTGTCASQTDYDSLVCGAAPDSDFGLGAVDICDECYVCGAADGVCPEDFYDSAQSKRGSCASCPDPDCQAKLTIHVENEYGEELGGVHSLVDYVDGDLTPFSDITDATGVVNSAQLYNVVSGDATVSISLEGYVSQQKTIQINRTNQTQHVYFTNFSQADCTSNCTREGSNLCDATCQGEAGCQFPSNDNYTLNITKTACNLNQHGESIYLGQLGQDVFYVECCSGSIYSQTRPLINIHDYQEIDIFGLVNHLQSVRLRGEQVFLVSSYWE